MGITEIFIIITAFLFICMVFYELYNPARKYPTEIKKRSYITNVLLFVLNNIIIFLSQLSTVMAIFLSYSPTTSFFSSLPILVQIIYGVILLDFFIWVWHVLNHKISLLWAFHKCHHSEKYLNASSALRFHIVELLLSAIWKAGVLLVFGIPLWVFLLSESLLTIFAIIHHSNIKFSQNIRKRIEMCFITPYLHRVHHSDIRSEHDSNYGVIFTWWDRLFRTQKLLIPKNIGLKNIGEKGLYHFFIFPFIKN